MDRYYARPKFRSGMAIAISELKDGKSKTADLMAELLMEPGYIGYIDAEDPGVRVYVFKGNQSQGKMLQLAKSLGFRTAGNVLDAVYISNEKLHRPHMKFVSKDNFYKELYK